MVEKPTDAAKPDLSRRSRWILAVTVLMTILVYFVPYGEYVAWPLVLFSTFVHEVGHGLAALLVGGSFHSFQLWADGSGLAEITGTTSSRLSVALVPAGGLVGPACLAAVFFACGRRPERARLGLCGLGLLMVLADILVVRNSFGFFYVLLVGAACLMIARWGSPIFSQLVLIFFAVQLSLSVFSRSDYLFTATARTKKGPMPSDVAQIANALGGPYWLWGFIVGVFSVVVLIFGLKVFFHRSTTDTKHTK